MKVFQIGFNKCGTTSIGHFFERNGLKAVHWGAGHLARVMKANYLLGNKLLEGIEDYDFYSDLEFVNDDQFIYAFKDYFKLLDQQYPGSKFILNTRSVTKWIQSRINHGGGTYLTRFKRIYKVETEEEVISQWLKLWYQHHADVITYFQDRDNFLLFDIENDDADKLVQFMSPMNMDKKHYMHIHKTNLDSPCH
ncbi:hypothetical protein GT360_13520 [Vibrio astriarenae]|uniref:Sulfotransferase family protein n=1 Tax=Vibrio astriarenae TaxID=1481923 RepID=A0A7Z2T506_9VIBR|nr:sulfotransferase [Vibrio astriarenae]QIA64446.1 hypothetical protein GT360_13520 [Vibrio astriarenae]